MDKPAFWIGFNVFVLIMLALDLGIFHRKRREITIKDALTWTGIWVAMALAFAMFIYSRQGYYKSMEFLTGYVIEKSLSLDNIFVIALIFGYFKTPPESQHKILFWGIIGALGLRAIFILAGISLLEKFQWMAYLFGGILIYTGIRLFFKKQNKVNPEKNWIVKASRKYLPFTTELRAGKFFVRENGKLLATPLFLVLLVVETSDVMFAFDSIPAILSVTHDSFIVYTSNVFAILGLRSLYFALAHIIEKFTYLQAALSVILIFAGVKMILEEVFKIPIYVSLVVILVVLSASVLFSVIKQRRGT